MMFRNHGTKSRLTKNNNNTRYVWNGEDKKKKTTQKNLNAISHDKRPPCICNSCPQCAFSSALDQLQCGWKHANVFSFAEVLEIRLIFAIHFVETQKLYSFCTSSNLAQRNDKYDKNMPSRLCKGNKMNPLYITCSFCMSHF